MDSNPIVALATPFGQSALAILRTSGEGSIEAIAKAFSRPQALLASRGHEVIHGAITDAAGTIIDEVMLIVFRGPRSYTGEDSVEISCHGSVPGIERLFERLFTLGFRQAVGGEFTLRAFLNGKLDLTRAEAVHEIITARSREAQALAIGRLSGSVERKIEAIKQSILRVMAAVSIQLDYAEDDVEEAPIDYAPLTTAAEDLRALAQTYAAGRRYQVGVRLALAGQTNAGKSSLFNALLREERSIVSKIPGTTRDYIEATMVIQGIPVRLYDTAGFRSAEEQIESEGIRRSDQVIEGAALTLYLIDGSAGTSPEDLALLERFKEDQRPLLVVWNKIDAALNPPPTQVAGIPVCPVSAQELTGLDRLLILIAEQLGANQASPDADLLIDSERQHRLIQSTIAALDQFQSGRQTGLGLDALAVDLQDAIRCLGEITGEVTTDDLLEVMFSGFCVGK